MANVKISQLASAGTLTGTEEVPVVQSGTTKKVTVQAIAALASGGGSSTFDIIANGTLGAQINVAYNQKAAILSDAQGTISAPVGNYASFNYYASGGMYGYGGAGTTATNISFSTVQYLGDVVVDGSSVVEHISFPEALLNVSNMSGLAFSGSALKTVSLPKLTMCNGISLNNSQSFQTITCPSLTTFSGYNGIVIQGNCALSSITSTNFPVLTKFIFSSQEPGNLVTVNLPSVTLIGNVYYSYYGNASGSSVLNTWSFSNVITYEQSNFNLSYHSQLANLTFGTVGTLKQLGPQGYTANINFSNCALTETSVNNLFIVLASLDGTNGTTASSYGGLYLQGGTNAVPTGAGLTAKDTLIARGWTIQHN